MDPSSNNHHNHHLGINQASKNIRKVPQPPPPPPPPQPQVYKISKNDFRAIVQQLTGTGTGTGASTADPPPHPKPPSMRLQRIRPPPLLAPHPPPPTRPAAQWADSPVSAYMRYLETSLQLSPMPSLPFPSPRPNPPPFVDLVSPRSPYPLLSPGFNHPPPLTPNFSFSPGPPSPGASSSRPRPLGSS